ncbi:aromatic acid exporter family protein [Alteribacillus sp. HJP-4]|uniref:aromatic acid exporter family protein n=1 Tax=Alteribacillus sp. HJP-4 TaxID=2775394 RepID=UPI0035CD3067
MGTFKIGYRTLKTAVGTALAIFTAQLLQLDFYVSAGIITILCITVTRKDSLRASVERVIASLIGLAIAGLLFEIIGYHPITLVILFLLFIPTAVAAGVKRGVVTSAVIMLHLYTLENVSFDILLNETGLVIIGTGVALLMNAYMPDAEKKLIWYQVKLEDCFRKIWQEYAAYLREGDVLWDGKEISEVSAIIEEGKGEALKNIENHFLRNDDYFYHYFKMREKQFAVLERILPFISSLDRSVIQGRKMAEFMEELSEAVSPGNTAGYFLMSLEELRREIKEMDLPVTREEFEVRSSLFYILHELEEYLLIKKMFKPDPKRTHTVSGKRLNRDRGNSDTN